MSIVEIAQAIIGGLFVTLWGLAWYARRNPHIDALAPLRDSPFFQMREPTPTQRRRAAIYHGVWFILAGFGVLGVHVVFSAMFMHDPLEPARLAIPAAAAGVCWVIAIFAFRSGRARSE